jgi:hypothetical protein
MRLVHAGASGAALAMMLVSGCGGGSNDTAADSIPAREVQITLERSACYGRCPVYRVEIDGTGKVVYEGRGFVKINGQQQDTVPARDVQALAREIEQSGYFGFRDNFPPDATDHPTVVTNVRIGTQSKRIEHNLGSRSAPAALETLYRRIDEVAGVKQWIGEEPIGEPAKGRSDTGKAPPMR